MERIAILGGNSLIGQHLLLALTTTNNSSSKAINVWESEEAVEVRIAGIILVVGSYPLVFRQQQFGFAKRQLVHWARCIGQRSSWMQHCESYMKSF